MIHYEMPFGACLHVHIDAVVTKPFFARKLEEYPDNIFWNKKTDAYKYHESIENICSDEISIT